MALEPLEKPQKIQDLQNQRQNAPFQFFMGVKTSVNIYIRR